MRSSLTLNELEAFIHLADTKNFHQAAARFHLSQPAFTRVIQSAERKLNTSLFDRNTRRVELTRSGEELLPIARRIVGEFHGSLSDLSEFIAGRSGHVKIACLPSVAAAVVPNVLLAFSQANPKVRFSVLPMQGELVLSEVLSGNADFGISTAPAVPRDDVAYDPLFVDDFVMICRRDDPLASLSEVSWAVFDTRPYIASGPASSTSSMVQRAMYEGGFHSQPRYECPNITVVGVMVAAGLGIASQPRAGLGLIDMRELHAVPLVQPVISRELGTLVHTRRSLSAAALALLEACRSGADTQASAAAFRRTPRPPAGSGPDSPPA